MTAIEIKALQEAEKNLKSIDWHNVYRVVSVELYSDKEVDKQDVLKQLNEACREERENIISALSWIETLLKDQKP